MGRDRERRRARGIVKSEWGEERPFQGRVKMLLLNPHGLLSPGLKAPNRVCDILAALKGRSSTLFLSYPALTRRARLFRPFGGSLLCSLKPESRHSLLNWIGENVKKGAVGRYAARGVGPTTICWSTYC